MNLLNKYKNLFVQIIKFGIIGVINAIIDMSIYWSLTRKLYIFKIFANILSFLIANLFSFFANRSITFKNIEKVSLKKYIKFLSITVISLIISSVCLFISITLIKSQDADIYGKIAGIILGAVWNFIMYKNSVFKKSKINNIINNISSN